MKDNIPHLIVGTVSNDTLQLQLLSNESGSVISQGTLLKKNSNARADAAKLFGNTKPQFDSRLIGTWTPIKTIGSTPISGPSARYTLTFHSTALVTVSSLVLDDIKSKMNNKTMLPTFDWQTLDNNLIIKRTTPSGLGLPPFPGPDVTVDQYFFRGDTLVVVNPKTQTYFLKKD